MAGPAGAAAQVARAEVVDGREGASRGQGAAGPSSFGDGPRGLRALLRAGLGAACVGTSLVEGLA